MPEAHTFGGGFDKILQQGSQGSLRTTPESIEQPILSFATAGSTDRSPLIHRFSPQRTLSSTEVTRRNWQRMSAKPRWARTCCGVAPVQRGHRNAFGHIQHLQSWWHPDQHLTGLHRKLHGFSVATVELAILVRTWYLGKRSKTKSNNSVEGSIGPDGAR